MSQNPATVEVPETASAKIEVPVPAPAADKVEVPVTTSAKIEVPVPASTKVEVPVTAPAKSEVPEPASAKIEVADTESAKIEVPLPVSANVEDPATVVEPVVVTEKETATDVPAVSVEEEKPTESAAGEETATAVVEETAPAAEDSNVAAELPEAQRKALEEFKELVKEALKKHEFTAPPSPPAPAAKEEDEKKNAEEETKGKEIVKEEEKAEEKPADAVVPVAETKVEEKPVELMAAEVKTEDKPVASPAAEAKPEEKPVAPPVSAETKKEEKPATEAKPEEKTVAPPTEEKPAAEPVVEAKTEDKPTTAEPITIEKAFAAEEDSTKTVELTEETTVAVSTEAAAEETPLEPEEVSIWGIPLLQDDRSDVVLLKFLRARDFKVKEALTMLKNAIRWRNAFKIDELLNEDLGNEFEHIIFIDGVDKLNRPVFYNLYSEFQNNELFANKETRTKFLRWSVQFHEKRVRELDFSPASRSSFVNVSDFRNAPGLGKRALWQFIKQTIQLFEDNYPEFVSKELFINVPWWYIPYYRTIGSVTSPRSTSKTVLAGPAKSIDTIFKYIAPEQVPVKFGGLSKNGEQEFGHEDIVNEVFIKPSAKHILDLPVPEACTLVWEFRVLGSEVSYGAQFEPSTEGSYAVIVSKTRKIGLTDEPVITDSFKVGEPGKVVLTIDNQTSKKKKLLYRFKTKPTSE